MKLGKPWWNCREEVDYTMTGQEEAGKSAPSSAVFLVRNQTKGKEKEEGAGAWARSQRGSLTMS